MTEGEAPAAPETPAAPVGDPETQAQERINELKETLALLTREIRTVEGKMANRNPQAIAQIKKENEALKARLTSLEKALFGILSESARPRQSDEASLRFETLRAIAAEHCKKVGIPEELWKSIAS